MACYEHWRTGILPEIAAGMEAAIELTAPRREK
jgi:hypothetical protein